MKENMKAKTIDVRKYISKKDSQIGDKFAKDMDELFLKAIEECKEWIYPSIRLIIFTENIINSIYKAFIEKESKNTTDYGIYVMQQLNETLKQLNTSKGIFAGMMEKVMEEEEKIMDEELNEI